MFRSFRAHAARQLMITSRTTGVPSTSIRFVTAFVSSSTSNVTKQQQPQKTSKEFVYEPKPPDPTTCCGSGCENCVWLRYFDDLDAYELESSGEPSSATTTTTTTDEVKQKKREVLAELEPSLRSFIEMEANLRRKNKQKQQQQQQQQVSSQTAT
eukprot:TRINITY_DN5346_c0_g2_i1.p1 TRINITY_DN5346_c0_g2~~TRINITY_DN5346_c0_g2_i1.p1  ORF type:complete len:155 (+),score=51.08 TRINITY_DN5346_c0_g2_i1:80-544(+)